MSDGLAAAIAAEGGDGGDAAAAAAAAAAAKGGGDGDGGQGDGGGGNGGGDPAWFESLSADAPEKGALSDRKWAAAKKYADIPSLVKAHRELEKQFLGGDKIVLPKEGASQDEMDAFFSKIGRPESADKYEIKAPEGKQLDEALVGKFRETAFKAGLPAAMATPLVEMFNAHALEAQEQGEALRASERTAGIAAVKKEWGNASPQNMAAANRAMAALGLSGADVDAIADALPPELGDDGETVKRNGTARTLDLLRRLGAGMGEDTLSGGGSAKKFGKSPAEAQARLDAIAADPALVKKLMDKDPVLTAERRQLIEIVSAGEDAEAAKN